MMPPHGTKRRYSKAGCRCDECRRANTMWMKAYKLRKLQGIPAPQDRVDATGAHRRLGALHVLGWSTPAVAAHAQISVETLRDIFHRSRIALVTHEAIARAYDELWDRVPPETTHEQKISASLARGFAARNGWAPPLAWDDDKIDDPASRPCGVRVREVPWQVEDFEELLRQGETHEAACRRLGATWKAVARRLHRAGRNDLLPWAWAGRRIA